MKSLLGIADLDRDDIQEILRVSESFAEIGERAIPKVPALRGKTIASLFYEESTRTRLSFEVAADRLSADVMNFSVTSSSVKKGESIRDTVQTIASMGVDAFVIRHTSAGTPHRVASWTGLPVINAGDGAHEHPTQALLDCFTLCQHLGRSSLEGQRIAIVGDIAHSRVARSALLAFTKLGAQVTIVGPPTLLPPSVQDWPVAVEYDLDDVLPKVDVLYTIRPQAERISEALLPSMREYIARYSVTTERADRLDEHAVIMEAGPLLRGVQMSGAVADSPRCLMNRQVANGVPVRMAVLFLLFQSDSYQPSDGPGTQ